MQQTNQCQCRKGLIAPVLYQPLARESKEAKHLVVQSVGLFLWSGWQIIISVFIIKFCKLTYG